MSAEEEGDYEKFGADTIRCEDLGYPLILSKTPLLASLLGNTRAFHLPTMADPLHIRLVHLSFILFIDQLLTNLSHSSLSSHPSTHTLQLTLILTHTRLCRISRPV